MSTVLFENWQPNAKKIFIVLSLLILLVMPVLSVQFGQNGDEDIEMEYGKDIYNFLFHGDQQAVSYDPSNHSFGANIQGMEYYGGMFNLITETAWRMNTDWNKYQVRHVFAALFGALMIIYTGLLAYRLGKRQWWLAILSMLFILFSPRIFGESMNNGKDIPYAMGLVMGIYYLVKILQDYTDKGTTTWRNFILISLAWAIVFGMRAAGGLLFPAYVGIFLVAYIFFTPGFLSKLKENGNKIFKEFILRFVIAFVLGYVIGLLSWPYGLISPISNVLEGFAAMANREVGLRVLFNGTYYNSLEMPWYYEPLWIFITNPVIVLVLFVLSLLLSIKITQLTNKFTTFLLWFNVLFPIIYIIYKNSTVYDTWRHVFFIYPYIVILGAFAVWAISTYFKGKLQLVPVAVSLVGLLPVMIWTVKSHPLQYTYFNEFQGGLPGAYGKYDIDYYHVSAKQSADWIKENVPVKTNGEKIRVYSNMDGMPSYFGADSNQYTYSYGRYFERGQLDWDYYITFSRFISSWQLENNTWPPKNAVHIIELSGVPIGVVLERKTKEDMLGYKAMQNKDYESAAAHYAKAIAIDDSDEMVLMNAAICFGSIGRIDEALSAVSKATSIDASRPDFYQLKAQLLQAKGDQAGAQEAMRMAQQMANIN